MPHPHLDRAIDKDILVQQGATFLWEFTWQDGATVVDVTGATVRMQARSQYDSATAAIDWDSTSEITRADTAPSITVSVLADATALLTPGDYVYDLEVDFGGNDVEKLFKGTLTVEPEATK